MRTVYCCLLAAAAVLFAPLLASAQALRGQLGASINNAGLQNTLELVWTREKLSTGIVHALLKSSGDRLLMATTVVMHRRTIGEGALSVGGIRMLTRVLGARQNDIQKIGAIAVREFAGTHLRLPRPKLTLVVARYLDDRSKDGQWTAAAAVGFRTR